MNWTEFRVRQRLTLFKDEIHIWRAELDYPSELLQQFEQILSPDELARAKRYRRECDRIHFTAARGILRIILSRYLEQNPEKIQFSYTQRGKPFLESANSSPNLQFNVSHSHGKALYAIALDRQVGIDLEYIRPIEVQELAKRFFSPKEYEILSVLPPQKQPLGFFQLWTCKEAYLKATGEGLAGLQQAEIAIELSELLQITVASQLISGWSLQPLDLGSDYAAAVAVEGEAYQMQCWQFSI